MVKQVAAVIALIMIAMIASILAAGYASPTRETTQNASCSPWRLQQVLGHSSLNVTAVYLQFNDRDIKELYDKTPF